MSTLPRFDSIDLGTASVPADAAERLQAAFDDLRAAGRVRRLVLVPGEAETETAVLDAELATAG